tara:strand:+ start:80 stop:268 length:189 start_codon:yes stop_codon:yes gene_type:complete
MEVLGQEFIDCVLEKCNPDCKLCVNDNKIKEKDMPYGVGTYGSKKGRPPKKSTKKKKMKKKK